ncbi:MAG: hypothetical protein HY981_03615 [Candidatus Magasanikbacteria bacterium]|nr:hypothetical protein [Candidatus Magasanikbacteria bacterium]
MMTTVLIGIILSGASLLLNESVQQVTLYSNSVDKEFKTVNKEILQVNNRLKQIELVTTSRKLWSQRILTILQQITSPAINISGLTVTNNGMSVSIQGKAQNRAAIIEVQSRLSHIDFIKDVTLPLENLIRENNVDFQITVQLK